MEKTASPTNHKDQNWATTLRMIRKSNALASHSIRDVFCAYWQVRSKGLHFDPPRVAVPEAGFSILPSPIEVNYASSVGYDYPSVILEDKA